MKDPRFSAECERINSETARIAWRDLQRYFAAGRVLVVSEGLDLIDTAARMVADDAASIAPLLEQGQLTAAADEQAATWFEKDAEVWAVVVAPWVLVQPVLPAAGPR